MLSSSIFTLRKLGLAEHKTILIIGLLTIFYATAKLCYGKLQDVEKNITYSCKYYRNP